MPLSAAEKQRRYRQKRDLDPTRREEYLQKEKKKYINDLSVGKKKRIIEMSVRDQRRTRRTWKKNKREYRKRKKEHNRVEQCLPTPDSSPAHTLPQDENQRGENMSRQKKRNIAKCYRDNSNLREHLEEQKRANNRLRKQLTRLRLKKDSNRQDTPRTKTRKLLRNLGNVNTSSKYERVRRTLFHHFTLTEELRNKYRKGSHSVKSTMAEILIGKLMRKYKLFSSMRKDFGFYSGGKNLQKKGSLTSRLEQKIKSFYERDDNSRLTSGIKETLTRNKNKTQKRVLLSTVEHLHNKFLMENKDVKISYSSFSRRRPFWVVPPKDSDRDTCICKQHENMQFIVDALHKNRCVDTHVLMDLVSTHSCDTSNMNCMYGLCSKCKEIKIKPEDADQKAETTWFKWQAIKEKRIIKNVEKEVSLTVKVEELGHINDLVETFSEGMAKFKQHVFNIGNQSQHYRHMKDNLADNESLIHIDFSENFECKMAREIQSVHFGASKRQITLHTGVYYTSEKMQTFCAVSDSLEHGPSGIWAYLDPILEKIINEKSK